MPSTSNILQRFVIYQNLGKVCLLSLSLMHLFYTSLQLFQCFIANNITYKRRNIICKIPLDECKPETLPSRAACEGEEFLKAYHSQLIVANFVEHSFPENHIDGEN